MVEQSKEQGVVCSDCKYSLMAHAWWCKVVKEFFAFWNSPEGKKKKREIMYTKIDRKKRKGK